MTYLESLWPVLKANGTPFFPAYTDHGTDHVLGVLGAATRLVPDEAWSDPDVFGPIDAATLIAASALHDLAMHIEPGGFLELVTSGGSFKPLAWFDRDQPGRAADVGWPDAWQAFCREAQRMGLSALDRILGPSHHGVPRVVQDPEWPYVEWNSFDYLIVGEFLRRWHSRLAHEIAVYGLPGAGDGFPVAVEVFGELGNLIGAAARSHTEDLRTMVSYLDDAYEGNLRPLGTAVIFVMGLLRLADYLQIESKRAPVILLHLKSPQSRLSIDEWHKHHAVSSLSWMNRDARALFIETGTPANLRIFLQLRDLFAALQAEFDTTAAVVRAAYPASVLATLPFTKERLVTNLTNPSTLERFPFAPVPALLQSAPDLFRLIIRPLYGDRPAVAGRELVQNAVDAVRALAQWQDESGVLVDETEQRSLDADVEVELREDLAGEWVLRVTDRGVGMTPETVAESFLSAGASDKPAWALHDRGVARWMQAGRFGIGAMAAFLLGSEFRLETRHASLGRGVSATVTLSGEPVQLDWAEMPVGTTIEVRFRLRDVWPDAPMEYLQSVSRFYTLASPSVLYRYGSQSEPSSTFVNRNVAALDPDKPTPRSWRRFDLSGYEAIYWAVPEEDGRATRTGARVSHNGILLADPRDSALSGTSYWWKAIEVRRLVREPTLSIFDPRHLMELPITRFALASSTIEWEEELTTSIGLDIVALAFVSPTTKHPLAVGEALEPIVAHEDALPLLPNLTGLKRGDRLCVLWHPPRKTNLHEKDYVADLPLSFEWRVAWPHEITTGRDDDERRRRDLFDRGSLFANKWNAFQTGRVYVSAKDEVIDCTRTDPETGEPVETLADQSLLIESIRKSGIVGQLRSVGIGVFAPRDDRVHAIARPWHELVGSHGISRDSAKRQEQLRLALDDNDRLQKHIEGWADRGH